MPHSPASLNLLQRIDDTEKKLNDDLSIKVRKLRDKAINREIEKAKGYQMPVTPVISVPQYLAQRTYSLAPRLLCEYKQIEKSNITELIPLYFEKEIIKDDNKKIILSFDTIRIFGEIENPMYSLKDIGITFNIPNVHDKIKNFDNDEKEKAIIIQSNGKKKPMMLLSNQGLYRLIWMTDSIISKLFKKFSTFTIDTLFTNKHLTLSEVEDHILKNHLPLYKNTLKMLRRNFLKIKKENNSLVKRIEFSIEQQNLAENNKKHLQYSLDNAIKDKFEQINKYNILEKDYNTLEKELNFNDDYLQQKDIKYIYEKYTKPIYIFLNDISHHLNISDKRANILSKIGIYDYDINDYDISNYSDLEDNKLYSLHNKKNKRKARVLVYKIYGSNDEIFEKLNSIMNNEYKNQYVINSILCNINDIIFEFNDIKMKMEKKLHTLL